MGELTIEQRRAIAIAKAKAKANVQPSGFMPQLNQGIANSAGGIVDFFNPFDKPHAMNPFDGGTGSASTGIERGMDAIGVNRATDRPRNLVEWLGRGAGEALGATPFAGVGAKVLSGAGGLFGSIMDDMSKGINTARGVLSEGFAGAGAQASGDAAERAGLPDWAQQAASIAGGVGVGSIPYVAGNTPSAIGGRWIANKVKSAALPYTESGGREVARQRVQDLAGGEGRARQLATRLQNGSEIGLTPAQQIGDPNILGLEQEAMRRNPLVREGIEGRMQTAEQTAKSAIQGMGGDPMDAQSFFAQRRENARNNITAFVERATNGALRPEARNTATQNSEAVADQIRMAEKVADQQEKSLWEAVPKGVQVGTSAAKSTAATLIQATPRAQQNDIPRVVRDLLSDNSNNPFGDFETVDEMHGLYSELRRVARSAMAGNDQNRNMARIANTVADAILDDLGANAGQSEVGMAIDAARAFSSEKHQIFSQGVVGKLLKRTLDGDDSIDPKLTLDRSLGRGGSTGAVGSDDILRAAGADAEPPLEDYLRSQFDRTAFAPDGSYNQRGGAAFMRDNQEMLQRFPYLKETLDEAVTTQNRAARTSERAGRVLADMDNPSKSLNTAFSSVAPERAVDEVFKAKRPAMAARTLVQTARKDESGAALDGLKGSFSGYVIRKATTSSGLSGRAMQEALKVPEARLALGNVFDPKELRRIDVIAAELAKLENARKSAPDIGGLSPRSPNRLIEMAARVLAARQGAKAGGGSSGASIQTANMASNRMREMLGGLQNDKAEQLLMDAVTDPELFRLLLIDPGKVTLKPDQINRLSPYFTGATAATLTE
jgi:hypothetical protein